MIHLPRITFRRVVRYSLIFLCIAAFSSYALWQARFLLIGPTIAISNNPPTVQTTRWVELTGTARNITGITLNGRAIYTNENGDFKEAVMLENGYTIVTITGTDRYGRTTAVERSFIYNPPLATSTNNT